MKNKQFKVYCIITYCRTSDGKVVDKNHEFIVNATDKYDARQTILRLQHLMDGNIIKIVITKVIEIVSIIEVDPTKKVKRG